MFEENRVAPPAGVIKITVDAPVGKNQHRDSIVVVARVTRLSINEPQQLFLRGAKTVEVSGCKEYVFLTMEIVAWKILVASNCQGAVISLKEGTKGAYVHIVCGIIENLLSFQSAKIIFEAWSSNEGTYSLSHRCIHEVAR